MTTGPRRIAAFMFFAVVFALIGHQVRAKTVANPVGDVRIILGGTIGTVLLALLSELGDQASAFAVGLSEVTLLSSVLINGAEVFPAISKATTVATVAPTTVKTPTRSTS